MPFVSRSQARAISAKEAAGELPPGAFKHWKSVTPNFNTLPERLHKKRTEKTASVPGPIKAFRRAAEMAKSDSHIFHATNLDNLTQILASKTIKKSGEAGYNKAWFTDHFYNNQRDYFPVNTHGAVAVPKSQVSDNMAHDDRGFVMVDKDIPLEPKSVVVLPNGMSRRDIKPGTATHDAIVKSRSRVLTRDNLLENNADYKADPKALSWMSMRNPMAETQIKKFMNKSASEKPHAAMIVAVTKDGDFIASTRPKDKRSHAGEIGLVGGKLEPGESARQAAIREAGEEGWDVKTVSKKPIHHSNHNGKVVAIFAAKHAHPKHNHKERHREVYPVTVTQEELAKSNPYNDFVAALNPEDLKAGVEKEAGWTSKALGTAALLFHSVGAMGGHTGAVGDVVGSLNGINMARRETKALMKTTTKTQRQMRLGGKMGDGGFKPPQQLLSGSVTPAPFTPHISNNLAPKPPVTGMQVPSAGGFKTASITGLCEKIAGNSVSVIPATQPPPTTSDQQMHDAATEKAQAIAEKNIAAVPRPVRPQ